MPSVTDLILRDTIGGDVQGVKNTFSSWDSCMAKAYCKWPVIIAIVVGSLIVLSLLFCLARCLCCGLECCCGCFTCCNACCPSPRGRSSRPAKYAEPPQQYQPYQGYQPNPIPPVYNSGPQQYAQFDAGHRKGNDDSLPAMPSWETSSSRKVLEEHKDEDVEMDRLDPLKEQNASLVANQAPSPIGLHNYGNKPYSDEMPYQHQGATHGGDLGNPYDQQSSVGSNSVYPSSGTLPLQTYPATRPAPGQQARRAPGQQTRLSGAGSPPVNANSPQQPQQPGYRQGPYQQQQQQPQQSYSCYAPSQSTRYEPSAQSTSPTARHSGPFQSQPFSSGSGPQPASHEPLQDSWRAV
ncbi:hypothetical protein MMC25_003799 [Agyrium rufum]|nr:hypothetical protein [Agyrium rufum]